MTIHSHTLVSALATALSILMCSACQKPLHGVEALHGWTTAHGLIDSQTVGTLTFKCAYRPLVVRSLLAKQAAEGNEPTSQFTLQIENKGHATDDVIFHGVGTEEEFNLRVRNLAFQYAENVVLHANGKMVPCSGAELMYDVGLSRTKSLILTFAMSESDMSRAKNVRIVIDDQVFSLNTIAFQIHTEDLANMPEVRL